MDTLAAIALSTEPPHASILTRYPPANKDEEIMSPVMWRQILGIAIYQVLAIVILMYFGRFMWDLKMDATQRFDNDGNPTDLGVLYTILFNTFVYMQIFNFINSRKIGERDYNVFLRFFNNWLFIFVVAIILVAQFAIVQLGGRMF